jgi:outer membrane usher protein
MRRALALAVALALSGPGVHAASSAGTDALAETIIELRINGQSVAETLVVRRDTDGALLIAASELSKLRLKKPLRGGILINGERYYRYGVDKGQALVFDDATQRADLTLPPSAFVATRARYASPDAPPVTRAGFGGFLNYDLYTQGGREVSSGGAFLELGMFGRYGVVTNTALTRIDRAGAGAVRLDSTWTKDFPSLLASLRVGDAISSSGAWGRSVRFGGVQFGTNFSTQPTLVKTPLLGTSGEAVVQSTVDVFVNGQRVTSETVPPGPFTIENVPAVNGAGQMQVVVTDALGRQQVIAQPYYVGSALLRSGLDEYSFDLGAIREDYGLRSLSYGDLVGAATWRRGLSDSFTAELHAEAQANGPRALGLDAAWQLGTLGILSASAAAGGDGRSDGWLGGVGFERNARHMSLFARTQFTSENFVQFGSSQLADRPRQLTFGGLGFNLASLGSLQFAYGLQQFWDAPQVETFGLSYSATLSDLGFLNFFATHSDSEGSTTDVLLTWTLPFGERRTASVGLRHGPEGDDPSAFEAVASIQQNAPVGSGAGYYLSASTSDRYQLGYELRSDKGEVAAEYARRDGNDAWRASARGGLALTSAGVMPSRTLDQSFAVIQLADFPGVEVEVDNQPVGRTDRKGRVLVDSLRPYEKNEVSIDANELPIDAVLATPSMVVTPAWRSGPVVAFPVTRARAATFRLRLEDGSVVPAGAVAQVGKRTYPVALDGLLYVEDRTAAKSAKVTWSGRSCQVGMQGIRSNEPLVDYGNVICRESAP